MLCYFHFLSPLQHILAWPRGLMTYGYYAHACWLKFVYCFQELIQYLKYTCPAHLYATSISPPAAEQIISAIKVILGEDGSSRGIWKNFHLSLSSLKCLFNCLDSDLDDYFVLFWLKCLLCQFRGSKTCKNTWEQQLFQVRAAKDGFWGSWG